ncbi:MAG TPA: DNA polymerase IV [Ilumatobacteraceae bacterium]|nr:DNA polymerase IV [Ilumatobacteraceae bacterium]
MSRRVVLHRVVLHVDMDAFYVSVELRRHPELAGQPVVVGGTGPRGVVAAASYEARRFGVTSALPSSVARRRCPHAVFLPGDHALYAAVSRDVHEIFRRFTPVVEPLSLDEAFLDVTGATRLFGDGVAIAHRIRDDIRAELELGCSVGVASNKFLAKLASVEAKPVASPDRVDPGRGVVEVVVGRELEFLHPLPVERLWGVGPVTLERLRRLGVRTVADLASIDESAVIASLGKANGTHLLNLARGIDDRPVEVNRELKSVGHEETFAHDLHDPADLDRELVRLCDAVASRLRERHIGARTLTLKVRFAGFETITRSTTRAEPVDTGPSVVVALRPLLDRVDPTPGVRLLGVSASNFGEPVEQLSLLEHADPASSVAAAARRAAGAVDEIRDRFGAMAIGPASSVGRNGLRLVRPGAQQWGPDHDPGDDRARPPA